jgi:hypothetical protein
MEAESGFEMLQVTILMLEKRGLLLEGLASQTPTPLNRSNLDLATTKPQFRKTNIRFGLFGATFIMRELLRIF